ncbi:activating signal cointegrator 1 complex subunit 1 [Episyrphus balteatus]|uniref:activating signal cointegrator 1 complex subunit 1 n=1 Tax=Episyrphus balteatus TaxID=286459 RepID=UPI0024868C4B|nr:activating signal cointegrator 1 complex subunit 1 [Episyrphus balteatus]
MSREVLSPSIVVIGKRHYRINPIHDGYGGPCSNIFKPGYQEEDMFGEDDEDTYDVEELENSLFRTQFHVPRVFYGGLIGQKGMTKRRIESETKTEIFIPGVRDTKESLVSIKGRSRKDVCAARRRVELVIESLRKKTQPTHFTCVPACTDAIKKAFNKFKESILYDNLPGIDEPLFQSAEKLHITFASCTLLDDEERVKAAQIFHDCKEFLASIPPIEVNVCGLEIMNDDPSSVAVLYARIESSGLQVLADKILQKFKEARLNNDEYRDAAKLHMTLMNVRGRLQRDPSSLSTFDARVICKKYADYDFGKFTVNEVHLSQMHTTGANGFYIATGILTV